MADPESSSEGGASQEIASEKPDQLEHQLTKAEQHFDEYLQNLKLKVEDGSERCMVGRRSRDAGGRWIYVCFPCGAICSGENVLQEHISGNKHRFKLLTDKLWPISIFNYYPTKKKANNATPQENAVPPTNTPVPTKTNRVLDAYQLKYEQYRSLKCHLQDSLDKLQSPIVGVEYLIEHAPEKEHYSPSYMCTLCMKQGQTLTIVNHLTSYWHRFTFLIRHFPTACEKLHGYVRDLRYRTEVAYLLAMLAQRIEDKYGRKRPVHIDKEEYERDKNHVHKWIAQDHHFSEKDGSTFEEVINEELLQSLFNPRDTKVDKDEKNQQKLPAVESSIIKDGQKQTANPAVSMLNNSSEQDMHQNKSLPKACYEQYKRATPCANPNKNVKFKQKQPNHEWKQKMAEEMCTATEEFAKHTLAYHMKNPEKHPSYPEEWRKFWNRRYKEIKAEGKDTKTYDFKPEWIVFWTARMKELHEEELRVQVHEIYRKLGMAPLEVNQQDLDDEEKPQKASSSVPSSKEQKPEPSAGRSRSPLDQRRASRDRRKDSSERRRSSPDRRRSSADRRRQSPGVRRPTPDRRRPSSDRHRLSADRRRSPPGLRRPAPERRKLTPDRRRLSSDRRRTPSDCRRTSADRHKVFIDHPKASSEQRRGSLDRHKDFPERRKPSPDRHKSSPDRRRSSPDLRRASPDRRRASSDRRRASSDRRRASSDRRRASPDKRKASPGRNRSPTDQRRNDYHSREPQLGRLYVRQDHRYFHNTRPLSSSHHHSPSRQGRPRSRSPLHRDALDRRSPVQNSSHERARPFASAFKTKVDRKRDNGHSSWDSENIDSIMSGPGASTLRLPTTDRLAQPFDDMMATLRQLVAVEDYLGSLGPRVVELLSEALTMEKQRPNSSDELLERDSALVLLETAKEKLKGAAQAGLVSGSAAAAVRAAVVRVAATLHEADRRLKRKKQVSLATAAKVASVPVGAGEVDRAKIARQIAVELITQGKTDVTSEQLAQLVETVVSVTEAKKRQDKMTNTAASDATGETVSNKLCGTEYALQALQAEYEKKDIKSKEDLQDAKIDLSDSDVKTLLKNFNQLSSEEQYNLAAYLKKLEAKEPQRVELLSQYVNNAPTKAATPTDSQQDSVNKEKQQTAPVEASKDHTEVIHSATQNDQKLEIPTKLINQEKSLESYLQDITKDLASSSDLFALIKGLKSTSAAPNIPKSVPIDAVLNSEDFDSFDDLLEDLTTEVDTSQPQIPPPQDSPKQPATVATPISLSSEASIIEPSNSKQGGMMPLQHALKLPEQLSPQLKSHTYSPTQQFQQSSQQQPDNNQNINVQTQQNLTFDLDRENRDIRPHLNDRHQQSQNQFSNNNNMWNNRGPTMSGSGPNNNPYNQGPRFNSMNGRGQNNNDMRPQNMINHLVRFDNQQNNFRGRGRGFYNAGMRGRGRGYY